MEQINKDWLLSIGFKELPTFTIMGSLNYDIGRNRFISIGCVGTPNEIMFLEELDIKDNKKITDLICIHNCDYDGHITKSKVIDLITIFNKKQ